MLHPEICRTQPNSPGAVSLPISALGRAGLLASPVQIAAMMNAIASGGVYHTPFFLECTVDETDGTPLETLAHPQSRRVMSAENAALLREMLCQVVEEGTAQDAAGLEGGAGGKTGTAQTGQFDAGRNRTQKSVVCRAFTRQKSPAGR